MHLTGEPYGITPVYVSNTWYTTTTRRRGKSCIDSPLFAIQIALTRSRSNRDIRRPDTGALAFCCLTMMCVFSELQNV
jgi:hypothetical protein